jgi:hypothetical protein
MLDGPTSGQVQRLFRAARTAARRQRLNAAVRRLLLLLPLPLGYGVLALAWVKWAAPSIDAPAAMTGHFRLLGYGWIVTLCVPVLGAVSGWLSQRTQQLGALALDRYHQSADRVTSALAFAELAPEQRSPWMDAAIADALRTVERPSAARAVPLHLPRATWLSVGLALLVVAISRLSSHQGPRPAPLPAPRAIAAVDLGEDDLAALRESAEELGQGRDNPELSSAVARFNQLVEQLAEHQLDRRQLFQRLADIERSLGAPSELDASVDQGLRDIASELEKSPLSRPIAEALKERRLADAERALRELAERLTRKETLSNSELERLRKALADAAQQSAGRVQRLEEARRNLEKEEQRRLLNKKKKAGEQAAAPDAAAADQRRRLDHLERERSEAARAQQELSQLDKDLAKAAQELMRELGQSASNLRSGAEDVNRMAQKQMTERDKQELKRKLEELKELLRQGGAGREEHQRRLRQFAERARGKPGDGSGKDPQDGNGPGGGKGQKELVLGPDGQPIPIPMQEQGSRAARPGSGDGPGKGEAGSQDWGSGTDPKLQGAPSQLEGKTEDVSAAAVDTGQGSSTSEVVFGAAESGFTGNRYQKVYTQYRTVAEDVLEQENIPAGYEFYVRRYFQLIRPRATP